MTSPGSMSQARNSCRSRSASRSGSGSKRLSCTGEIDAALPEELGLEPAAPAMRALHIFDAGRAIDRIERQPQRDDLLTVDRIVGLVVMPRRALLRARLLHQKMVVIVDDLVASPSDAPRSRAPASRRRKTRASGWRCQSWKSTKNSPGASLGVLMRTIGPGARHVGIDRRAQPLDPVERESAAQADGAIARDIARSPRRSAGVIRSPRNRRRGPCRQQTGRRPCASPPATPASRAAPR